MKKFVSMLLGLLAAAPMLSCSGDTTPSGRFVVAASFYPVYIIAKNVAAGVEGAAVVNITPPVTGCLHDYTLTARDMKRLEGANILLVNGAGMENFLGAVAEKHPSIRVFELSQGIPMLGGDEGANPHVWVAPGNMAAMTRNCARALAQADPVNAASYEKNAASYIAEIEALRKEMHGALDRYRGRPIITFHEAFPYFAAEFGLKIAAVIEREPGTEPSAKEVADTVDIVRKNKIKALFAEPQYPSSAAKTIARETGAVVYTLDPAVTGPDDNRAYIDIMRKNLAIIEKALK
ncbi:MAG TPA: metal ABC transporter substrate-binding protein [Spirochaetota bacterium]|nr:metal ABC transporter substrate-binding protein [Spirochaetota bacterium]